MLKFLTLVLRMVKENRLRVALTAAGVATAIFVFCFFFSIRGGMTELVSQASQGNNLIVMEQNKW